MLWNPTPLLFPVNVSAWIARVSRQSESVTRYHHNDVKNVINVTITAGSESPGRLSRPCCGIREPCFHVKFSAPIASANGRTESVTRCHHNDVEDVINVIIIAGPGCPGATVKNFLWNPCPLFPGQGFRADCTCQRTDSVGDPVRSKRS